MVAPSSIPRVQFRITHLLIVMGGVALIAWAVQSWQSLYETVGNLDSLCPLLFFAVGVFCTSFCLLVTPLRRPWLVLVAIILVVFSAWQTRLGWRLEAYRAEVDCIIKYVDDYHAEHGDYPADLRDYSFERPEMSPFISYEYPIQQNKSYLIFWNPTGEKSYGHYYSPEDGHWFEDD